MFDQSWEDVYFPDSGTVEYANCGVCGDLMEVERDCFGPTNYVGSIRYGRNYDFFFCLNKEKLWHKQMLELWYNVRDTPSPSLRNMFIEDAKLILRNREPNIYVYSKKENK